jgi:hypothetical protein
MAQTVTSIDRATIVRVYSGRPGCGCGCNGTYYEDARNITRVVNLMQRRAAAGEAIETIEGIDGPIYSVENETRYLWAYAG